MKRSDRTRKLFGFLRAHRHARAIVISQVRCTLVDAPRAAGTTVAAPLATEDGQGFVLTTGAAE